MINFFRKMVNVSVTFDGYIQITFQRHRKSLLYFLGIITLTALLIFPPLWKRQMDQLDPVLDSLSASFPALQFKDFQLQPPSPSPLIIHHAPIGLVIDPDGLYKKDPLFTGHWFHFRKTHFQVNQSESLGPWIKYQDPVITSLLIHVAGLNTEGEGFVEGSFFTQLKNILHGYLGKVGFLFLIFFACIAFICHTFLTLVNYSYSQIIRTPLTWKEIRNITYYAITPALGFLALLSWLPLPRHVLEHSNLFLFIIYFLFSVGAIRQFKPQEEEVVDEEEYF